MPGKKTKWNKKPLTKWNLNRFGKKLFALNCSASFLWESASSIVFCLSGFLLWKKKARNWNSFLLIKPCLPSTCITKSWNTITTAFILHKSPWEVQSNPEFIYGDYQVWLWKGYIVLKNEYEIHFSWSGTLLHNLPFVI